MLRKALIVLLVSACAACVSYGEDENDVHQQAVHDIGCPAEKIDVTLISEKNRTYCAYGCGNSRAYSCSFAGCSEALFDWCP
jgi:hypothetical protein